MVALGVWLWGCCVGKQIKILQESLEDIGRVQTQDPTRVGWYSNRIFPQPSSRSDILPKLFQPGHAPGAQPQIQ